MLVQVPRDLVLIDTAPQNGRLSVICNRDAVQLPQIDRYPVLDFRQIGRGAMLSVGGQERDVEGVRKFDLGLPLLV